MKFLFVIVFYAIHGELYAAPYFDVPSKVDSPKAVWNTIRNKSEDFDKYSCDDLYRVAIRCYEEQAWSVAKSNLVRIINEQCEVADEHNIKIHYYLGRSYMALSGRDSALIFFLKTLELLPANDIGDINKCRLLADIGYLEDREARDEKPVAIQYYDQAIQCFKERNDTIGITRTYNDIGLHFMYSNFDSAEVAFSQALDYALVTNDTALEAHVLNNLVGLYLNFESKKDYPKIKNYLGRVRELWMVDSNYYNLTRLYYHYGSYYSSTDNQKEKGIEYFEKSIQYAEANEDKNIMINLYGILSGIYQESGNLKMALKYSDMHFHLYEDIMSLEKNKAFREIQTKYEVEKKNNEIALLQKEAELKTKQQIGMSIILGLLIMGFGGGFWAYRAHMRNQQIIAQKEKQRLLQEKELELARGEIKGIEQERNRIAQELHDGVCSELAAARLEIEAANQQLQLESLDKSQAIMRDVLYDIRHLSHELSSAKWQRYSFEELLQQMYDYYSRYFGLQIIVFPPNWINTLSGDTKLHLYRIIQEMLSNVRKHAQAQQVILQLLEHEQGIRLMIEDDGIGYDTSQRSGGIGLGNIEERVSLLDGVLTTESQLGGGTIMTLDFPKEKSYHYPNAV